MSVWDDIEWIQDGISDILDFILTLTQLGVSILGLITGVFSDIFNTNPYAAIFFTLILMGVSLVIFIRVWNIMADIQLWGFKLPKL